MGLFHKHPRVFIESMDIYPMLKDNLDRCITGGGMSNNNANVQKSVSDAE